MMARAIERLRSHEATTAMTEPRTEPRLRPDSATCWTVISASGRSMGG